VSSTSVFAQSANRYFKQGQSAEARDDFDTAFQDYQKAYSMSPKNESFRAAFYRVRFTDAAMHVTKGRNLLAAGNEEGALSELFAPTRSIQATRRRRRRSRRSEPVTGNSLWSRAFLR